MNTCKKKRTITGSPIYPITVGAAALIAEKERIRRTSTVLNVETFSKDEVRFETINTCYRLIIAKRKAVADLSTTHRCCHNSKETIETESNRTEAL